jgi:hypothetical protein
MTAFPPPLFAQSIQHVRLKIGPKRQSIDPEGAGSDWQMYPRSQPLRIVAALCEISPSSALRVVARSPEHLPTAPPERIRRT